MEETRAEKIMRELPGLSDPELIYVLNQLSGELQARLMAYAGERHPARPAEYPEDGDGHKLPW